MFTFLLVAVVAIALIEVASREKQTEYMTLLKQHYIDYLSTLAEVNIATGNLFLSYRNYYLEYPDQEKVQVKLTDINERMKFILTELQSYHQSLTERNGSQEELNNTAAAVEAARNTTELIEDSTKKAFEGAKRPVLTKLYREFRRCPKLPKPIRLGYKPTKCGVCAGIVRTSRASKGYIGEI